MSHEIESLDNVGLHSEPAWHGLGTIIQENKSAVEAAEFFGLTYPITQWSLAARSPRAVAALENFNRAAAMPGISPGRLIEFFDEYQAATLNVDTHVANVRGDGADARHLLGIVGADYQVCQNRELAEFTDALAQTGRVVIESCGTIRNGKRVWFLARGDAFTIGGTEDTLHPYVLVSNGHDGTQAIRVTPTTVRVVCSNTLHMVIPRDEQSERPDSAAITIRHSGKIMDKLEQAKRAMAYYGATLQRNHDLFEAMQAKRVDQATAMKLFADSYAAFWEVADATDLASPDGAVKKLAERRAERMQSASDAFMQRWTDEQTKLGIGSTVWSAFNAMTGFVQHDKTSRGKDDAARVDSRRDSNLFGINASRTHDVLAASVALLG